MSHDLLVFRVGVFVLMILGHFIGDYLLQNQWMATKKSKPGLEGHVACTWHVLAYTTAISLVVGWFIHLPILLWSLLLLSIAIPHWFIDRFSFGWTFLRWKNGYSEHEVWEKAPLCAALERNVWKTAFYAPVYIMNDNTMHFICLWLTVLTFIR